VLKAVKFWKGEREKAPSRETKSVQSDTVFYPEPSLIFSMHHEKSGNRDGRKRRPDKPMEESTIEEGFWGTHCILRDRLCYLHRSERRRDKGA